MKKKYIIRLIGIVKNNKSLSCDQIREEKYVYKRRLMDIRSIFENNLGNSEKILLFLILE